MTDRDKMPKFEEVFGAVPERSPGEVSAFIDKARSGDEELPLPVQQAKLLKPLVPIG
jgi:hypothetical protein